MTDALPRPRFHAGVMVVLSLLISAGNGLLSIMMVALAVPGNGMVGLGFRVIAGCFVVGNVLALGAGLYAARFPRRPVQIVGLLAQFLTIPLCIGAATLVMVVFGINEL